MNNDIKLLGSNITFFGLIQLSQYLIPIITMPYLLRIIGFDNYGLIAFSQAIIGILLVVTDYGFNISGPRYVSSKQNDLNVLNNYFLKVIFVKLMFLFISLILILLMNLIFNSFRENQLITYLLLMIVLGNVFNPTWFFQGMENIKPVALTNLSFRFIYVACIFIFINKESDFLLVPLLMGLSFLLPGILNLLLCVKIYKIKIYSIDFFQLIEIIKSDFEIFKSRIYVALYNACVPLTLGVISTPSLLAAYTVAERLSTAVINVFTPIANATYPYLSRIYQENKKDFLLRFNKINRYYFLCLILIAVIVFLQAGFIIEVFTGSNNVTSIIILRVFCVFILIAPFARTYSNGLFILRHERFISISTFFAFLLVLSSSIPLVYFYDAIGGSISLVVAQFINISMIMIYFHRVSKNIV